MTQQTAQGLASLGRGPDSMLVHMAPGEVKSLQQLAMAHGGSLTINPQTGLPEAGFLSSILPMIIGGGLTIASGGALSPLMAGLITGGGYGLATGSMKKGLMAGLGAYGGAGLGSALAGAGVEAAASTELAKDAAYKTAQETMQSQATALGQNAAGMDPTLFADQARGLTAPVTGMQETALANAKNAFTSANPFERLQTAGSGISNLGSEAGRSAFMTQVGGGKGLMQAGLMAAAPMMETTTKQPEIKTDKDMGQRYQFNAGAPTPTPPPDVPGYEDQGRNFGREQRYFRPAYTPIDNEAARRMYGFASGGPVEAMSNANAIGMNTGYPQADIGIGQYATPYQQPISRDVVQSQYAGGGSINLQGTFDMGGGQGGQGGGSNNPQPFIGNNDSPSMPQQGSAPMPGNESARMRYDMMPQPAVVGYKRPSFEQYLAEMGPMSRGIAFADGGRVAFGKLFERVLPKKEEKTNGYSFDPATQKYVQNSQMAVPDSGTYGSGETLAAYSFDPKTQRYTQTRAAAPPPAPVVVDTGVYDGGGGGGGGDYGGGAPSSNSAPSEGGGMSNQGEGGGGRGEGGWARGGIASLARGGNAYNLGDYSDGGRLLRGPGDGISDSIPAMIGKKQPARLADGEFVVPARIVSELGNGSTEAGARKLYAMMDRVQKARGKTIGKGKVAANSRSSKYLPA